MLVDHAPQMYEIQEPLYEGEMVLTQNDVKGKILQSKMLGSGNEISIEEQEQYLSVTYREGKSVPCKLSTIY